MYIKSFRNKNCLGWLKILKFRLSEAAAKGDRQLLLLLYIVIVILNVICSGIVIVVAIIVIVVMTIVVLIGCGGQWYWCSYRC